MNFTLYIACSSTHFDKIVSKILYFHEILYKTLHDLYFSFTLDNIWISDLSGWENWQTKSKDEILLRCGLGVARL